MKRNNILILIITTIGIALFYSDYVIENKFIDIVKAIIYFLGALTLGFIIEEIIKRIKDKRNKMTLS